MCTSTDYQFLWAAAFGELSKMQSLAAENANNNLNITAVDEDGSVLAAASERFHHDAVRWQYHKMNALHLSCLMGHEEIIQYLSVQFPVLLDGKNEGGETPLLTLTRTVGLVTTVSDQCFDRLLCFSHALNSSNAENVNSLHHLAGLKNPSKLVSYLNVFTSSAEDINLILTNVLPNTLINTIVAYGNFYSKTAIANTLNQVSLLGSTPLSRSNDQTRPLLLKAGAVNDKVIPVINNPPSRKRKSTFEQLRSFFW